MKKKIDVFKNFDINKLYVIQNYITSSKVFFKTLSDILSNIDLSNDDKIIAINNLLKEFESNVRL